MQVKTAEGFSKTEPFEKQALHRTHRALCQKSASASVSLSVLLYMTRDEDVQVKTAEGFSKRELFEKLAPLEEATRPLMQKARQTLGQAKGQSALEPWNIGYSLSGACFTDAHAAFPLLCLFLLGLIF